MLFRTKESIQYRCRKNFFLSFTCFPSQKNRYRTTWVGVNYSYVHSSKVNIPQLNIEYFLHAQWWRLRHTHKPPPASPSNHSRISSRACLSVATFNQQNVWNVSANFLRRIHYLFLSSFLRPPNVIEEKKKLLRKCFFLLFSFTSR